MSSWGRDDIVARYGLDPGKILIVPGAPATSAYDPATDDDVLAVRERLGLPGQFAVYPAKAWPHKNHLRLVAALKVLRDRGVDVPIVMTGAQDGRDRPVMAAAEADGVSDLVHFTGFVEPADLNAIYRAARMMVFPSLFEGWGLPVLEALAAGLPLACSQVTCLPAITAGAADLFDPYDPAAIAGAIERVWLDHGTRARLTTAGRIRAARFSWDLSARMFRACYRLLGGRALSPEDQALLDAPPLA
jgi:glycosyltransferase involved in cell wall biosynthesis